jgi:hypothetical protein
VPHCVYCGHTTDVVEVELTISYLITDKRRTK